MPDWQRCFTRSLRARLAHHFDLRRLRFRRGERQTSRSGRGPNVARAWYRRQPIRRQCWNSPSGAKNVSVGNAARNGVFAALLAEQGYTAAPAAIEGVLGWARAMGDEPAVSEITGALGERWE